MGTEFLSPNSDSDIHLVDVDLESLPCMLCSPSSEERFNSMRNLLEHFTNEHMAIHVYGCNLCNQATSSYPDFILHECFAGKEEFELSDPKFIYCHASLVCSDCGLQFLLNGTVNNKQSMHEYLSLMAVHNSISMKLVCIYSIGVLKKDQDYFYMNHTSKMSKFDFLCKTDAELRKCCPSLCTKYYDQNSVALATFARTAKQSECLELINMSTRMKSASIDDILSPVIQTETKLRNIMQNGLKHRNNSSKSPFNIADENNIFLSDDNKKSFSTRFCVSNFETSIPKDILKGFLFEKDVYECSSCFNLFDGLNSVQNHWKDCSLKSSSLTKFDPLNSRCVRLVFNKNLHPSKRVGCNKCLDRSFCSFIGLRLHYARDHSLFIDDDHEKISNKKDIRTYGKEVVAKCINEYLKNESDYKFEGKTRSDSLSSDESLMQSSRSKRSKWGVVGRTGRLSQDQKPKRVSFTRVEHKRREGSTNLEEILSSQGSHVERSLTPASSSSEMPRRRQNVASLGVEEDGSRSTRRSRISRSPNVIDDHNSSTGSMVDNSQRTRPRSERAKQMELKKQEKALREKEDEEKEDREREKRRRRKLADQNEGISEFASNASSQPPVLINQTLINNNELSRIANNEATIRKRPRLEPNITINDDVEIIDLSDDSDENQKELVASTRTKQVSRTSSQQSNLSDNCSLFCFFCGQDIPHTVEFVHHMERHTEVFHRCPVCIVLSHKEHQFKHVLHVVDHIVEKHIRKDDDHCICPFCHKDFGCLSQIHPLYLCFQHILFSCDRSRYCMLCLATNDDCNVHKLRENFVSHCNEKHTYVYNKFICSKCMTGFPTKFLFIEHTCSYVHRCACDISRPFANKQAFFEHERSSDDTVDHYPIKPIGGSRGIYLPNSYRKQLKAMEIELCKKRKINYPERNDYFLFFQKYPHLFLAFEPLSSLAKNLPIIKVPSIEGSNQPLNLLDILNQNPNGPFNTQKRLMANGESIDTQSPKNAVKHLKKRRRKHVNPEVQLQNAKKVEPAKCFRSDVVWKEAAKYDGELDDVADVLEDLILSVSDNATMFANGLFKSTRSTHKRPMPKPQVKQQFVTPTPISQQNLVARVVQPTQSVNRMKQDLSIVDSSPLMQRIMNAGASLDGPFLNDSSLNHNAKDSRVEDESGDDEIEVIGEVQRQSHTQPPQLIQTQSKGYVLLPAKGRMINGNSSFGSQKSSLSSMLTNRPKTATTNNNGAVQDWINNYQ